MPGSRPTLRWPLLLLHAWQGWACPCLCLHLPCVTVRCLGCCLKQQQGQCCKRS